MEVTQNAALAQPQADGLTPEQFQKVREIAGSLQIEDSQAVLLYGVQAQRSISDYSDNVLEQIRSKDSGDGLEALASLMRDVRSLDVDSIAKRPGFFARLFFSMNRRMRLFIDRYEILSVEIEKTLRGLDAAKMRLLRTLRFWTGCTRKIWKTCARWICIFWRASRRWRISGYCCPVLSGRRNSLQTLR